MPFPVKDTSQGASFLVRIHPRASRTAVVSALGDDADAALKISLHAPPVEGRANAALTEFLAEVLATPQSAIEIAGGQHSRNKRIVVRGRNAAEVARMIEAALRTAKDARPHEL